jgi:hypothetical protein
MLRHEYCHLAAFARLYNESSNPNEVLELFFNNIPDALWSQDDDEYCWEAGTAVAGKLHQR